MRSELSALVHKLSPCEADADGEPVYKLGHAELLGLLELAHVEGQRAASHAERQATIEYLEARGRSLYARAQAARNASWRRDATILYAVAGDLRLGLHLPSREEEIAEAIEKAAADIEKDKEPR